MTVSVKAVPVSSFFIDENFSMEENSVEYPSATSDMTFAIQDYRLVEFGLEFMEKYQHGYGQNRNYTAIEWWEDVFDNGLPDSCTFECIDLDLGYGFACNCAYEREERAEWNRLAEELTPLVDKLCGTADISPVYMDGWEAEHYSEDDITDEPFDEESETEVDILTPHPHAHPRARIAGSKLDWRLCHVTDRRNAKQNRRDIIVSRKKRQRSTFVPPQPVFDQPQPWYVIAEEPESVLTDEPAIYTNRYGQPIWDWESDWTGMAPLNKELEGCFCHDMDICLYGQEFHPDIEDKVAPAPVVDYTEPYVPDYPREPDYVENYDCYPESYLDLYDEDIDDADACDCPMFECTCAYERDDYDEEKFSDIIFQIDDSDKEPEPDESDSSFIPPRPHADDYPHRKPTSFRKRDDRNTKRRRSRVIVTRSMRINVRSLVEAA